MDKEQIISEIKRTTKENGGNPLGRSQFSSVTGIKTHEWCGKYWARWSEALIEAGFSPNKLQTAIDEKLLFEKYIVLTRELGHLPIESELRLKSRRDSTFPSHSTFRSRFISKMELVKRLNKYCDNQEEYMDISILCNNYSENIHEKEEINSEQNDQRGYVYLIKMGRYFKIGRTINPIRREGEIILQLPEKSQPLHYIETDDPAGIENYWHKRFSEKRMEGEWFALTPDDIRAFKKWRRIA